MSREWPDPGSGTWVVTKIADEKVVIVRVEQIIVDIVSKIHPRIIFLLVEKREHTS